MVIDESRGTPLTRQSFLVALIFLAGLCPAGAQNKKQDAERYLNSAIQAFEFGRNDEARKSYEDARRLYQVEENRMGEANVLFGLGNLEHTLGRNDEARKAYEDARRLFQAVHNRPGEANVLFGLGKLESTLGRNDEARKAFEDARRLYQAVQNRLGEANALRGLGDLERKLGSYVAARRHYRDASVYFGLAGSLPEQKEMDAWVVQSDTELAQGLGHPNGSMTRHLSDWVGGWKFWLILAGVLVALGAWFKYQGSDISRPPSAGASAVEGRRWRHYDAAVDTAVVFVHGIFSSPAAFKNELSGAFWPEIVYADARTDRPNVYLGQFSTAVDSGAFDIPQAAEELRVQLSTTSADGKAAPLRANRMVFVAHSTGGLVARDLLTRHPELFRAKNIGLVLVASPSRGSAWADRLKIVIDLAGNRMAGQLRQGNEWLADLDRRFADFVHKTDEDRGFSLKGMDLFENRFVLQQPLLRWFVSTRTVVVSERDSASYFGAGKIVPDTDHFSVAKPNNADHASHRYLMEWWINQFKRKRDDRAVR